MRTWPHTAKQALRFLAAARYFLPVELECPGDWVTGYDACLRQSDFQDALEALERIGDLHANYPTESHFWKELFYAAQHLELAEHAARYEERIEQLAMMQQLQF